MYKRRTDKKQEKELQRISQFADARAGVKAGYVMIIRIIMIIIMIIIINNLYFTRVTQSNTGFFFCCGPHI